MTVTRHDVAGRLTDFLQGRLSLAALVDWAEQTLIEADFDSPEARDATARIGVADVRAFGLTWEDCRSLLNDLGYDAHVQVVA